MDSTVYICGGLDIYLSLVLTPTSHCIVIIKILILKEFYGYIYIFINSKKQISKIETFINSRFITCKVKLKLYFICLHFMIRAYSS